ncbi:hypothetical protein EBR43_13940 [bacterium]|nr:hypothetical protein [bacterium]
MPAQPLNPYDTYFDHILNAVLQADGTVDKNDCHQFTILYPSYSALVLHDSVIGRLVPCKYDHWSNEMEYFDVTLSVTVKINLATGVRSTHSTASSTPPKVQQPLSQQNWGWSGKNEEKKQEEPKKSAFPFKPGAILFHKTLRTKWIYDGIDNTTKHPVLRSFYDKTKAMQVLDKDYNEFEEVFF